MGINLMWYKTLSFVISAFFGGLAGALYAPVVSFIDPSSFDLLVSVLLLEMVIALPGVTLHMLDLFESLVYPCNRCRQYGVPP
jgi:branched-subunit amino acid ABC-type transport system permease component